MPEPLDVLHKAIHDNDAAAVRAALNDHPELKPTIDAALPHGPFGQTAMLAAVQKRNLQIVDLLLAAGADINVGSHWWAGSFNVLDETDAAFLPALLERGATMTPHAAARLGLIDRLRELIAADPSMVHKRGGDGQLPLHFASTIEIAELLLAHGAVIDAIDVDHESTAAQWMLGDVVDGDYPRSRHDIARFLVSRGCRTDILMAAALGDVERVKTHLAGDPASIRTSVSERWFPKRDPRAGGTIYTWTLGAHRTAPLVARKFGHDEAFALLMKASPPEMQLAVACLLGDESLCRSLLAAHPNLAQHLTDDERRQVVDAAQHGNQTGVRLMLEAGWPVDARGQHGATALHWAGFHGNAAMTREILKHRPPLEARTTEFDGTPLDWTVYGSRYGWDPKSGDYTGTVEALLDAGARMPANTEHASDTVRDVIRRYNRGGS
jgi:ankyrin repeat protein